MPDPVIVTPHHDDPYSRLDFASFANTDAESLFEEDVEEMRQGINRRYSEIISTGTPIQEHYQQNWDQASPKPTLHHVSLVFFSVFARE
jgi:glutamine synthetase adenylyltransferase